MKYNKLINVVIDANFTSGHTPDFNPALCGFVSNSKLIVPQYMVISITWNKQSNMEVLYLQNIGFEAIQSGQ